MNKNPEKQNLELSLDLLLQIERGPGRCRSERENYADINLIVRRKNHKHQSVPVVVPNKIDSTTSLNSRAANRKSTNMELALDLELSCKRHDVSEHNRKQERVETEE